MTRDILAPNSPHLLFRRTPYSHAPFRYTCNTFSSSQPPLSDLWTCDLQALSASEFPGATWDTFLQKLYQVPIWDADKNGLGGWGQVIA